MAFDEARYREARRTALLGLVVSACLAGLKITAGLVGGSVASVADGIESGADAVVSGLLAACLFWASRPADDDHPYGHGRLETAAGLGVGVMLVFTGGLVTVQTLTGMGEPRDPPALWTLLPLVMSAGAKAGLSVVKFRRGRRLGSAALVADAWNDAVDVVSAVAAAAGVALALQGGRWTSADDVAGAVVGGLIVMVGLRVVRDATLELMDTRPDPELMARVDAAAAGVPGVVRVETMRGRKSGLSFYFDLHVEVAPDLTVARGHDIAHRVKDAVRAAASEVADVLVHIEPDSHAPLRAGSPGSFPDGRP